MTPPSSLGLSLFRSSSIISSLLLISALLAFPATLSGHAKLLRSNPQSGATLAAPPARLALTFTERPEIPLSSVKLVGPAGDTISLVLGRDSADRNTLVAAIPPGMAPGNYRAIWRAAGSDGHPSRGVIEFVVKDQAIASPSQAVTPPPEMSDDPAVPAAVGGALGAIIARWLTFASMFIAIGVVAFRILVLGRLSPAGGGLFTEIAESNSATLGMFASVGVILGALLRLHRETLDMPDAPIAGMMLGSIWGLSMLLQILGALGLLVSLYLVHKAREEKRSNAWRSAMLSAVALAIAPALGGHAMASEPVIVSVLADVVHVAAGSVWLGTLAVIMMVGISSALKTPDTVRPGERVASLINLFSPIALICGGTMIATGVISAAFHLPELRSLWTTPYGAALTLKLFFVALLFGAGAWNWRRMKPRLTGDDAIAPMRSSATLELVIAAVVLGITAILVALELP